MFKIDDIFAKIHRYMYYEVYVDAKIASIQNVSK